MPEAGNFKNVDRAEATGQRYPQAPTDLEGLPARMSHQPLGEQLLSHLRDRYGIDAVAATQVSQHHGHVFRIDRRDGDPWIVRTFSLARPQVGVEGDAAILRFLEQHDYRRSDSPPTTPYRRSTIRLSSSPASSPADRSPWPSGLKRTIRTSHRNQV